MALEIIAYAKHNLEKGERIFHQTRVHGIILLKPILLSLIGIAVMVAAGLPNISVLRANPIEAFFANPWVMFWPLGAIMTLQAVALLIKRLLILITTEITVTTRRVIWKTGFVWRDTDSISRARVEGCRLADQSWLGQWLDYGTVEVKGIGGNTMTLRLARNPKELQKQVTRPLPKKADSRTSKTTTSDGDST